mgnify:CR=1 FL=1
MKLAPLQPVRCARSERVESRSRSQITAPASATLNSRVRNAAILQAASFPARILRFVPRVSIEGRSSGRADEEPFVNFQVIDPGYVRAMRIPLLRGRAFTHTDDMDAPPVALVSARTAQRFWPDTDPIGRRR